MFDAPHAAHAAQAAIEAAALSDRCEVIGGNLFREPIPGADVHVFSES